MTALFIIGTCAGICPMQTAAYGTIILAHWNGQTPYPPVARVSSENVLAPAIGSYAALLVTTGMDADLFQLQAPRSHANEKAFASRQNLAMIASIYY